MIVYRLYIVAVLLIGCTAKPEDEFSETIPSDDPKQKELKERVYICDSPFGTRYHYFEQCEGLGNCTHSIVGIERSQADSLGYSLCGYEE